MVFCISAAFCAVGMIVYLLFASDETQAWAKTGEEHGGQTQKESLTAVEENNSLLAVVGNEKEEKA